MRKKDRTLARLRRILCAVLTVALLVPLPVTMAPAAQATTQSELDSLKREASQISQEKKQLQNQLNQITTEKKNAVNRKQVLEQQVNVLESEIKNIDGQILAYDALIAEKEAALVESEQQEAELYELFCQRVRYMEEDGSVNYWAILFNATDFADLLDRFIMVDEIMEYDNAVMDSLLATREEIRQDKETLETARTERQQTKQQRENSKQELETKEAEVADIISDLEKEASETQKEIKELEAQAKAMDEEIARKEKELQATNIVTESEYKWPLPGYTALSSLFAGRIDPFTGKPATHSGIDVPAPKGVKVLAAKSGTVLTSGYNQGGYGNYVVILHGSGNTTLYAHLSSRSVKEGEQVKQGQVVGLVGSTGRSTGNHLHYEIRVNNVRIDPVTKYSGLTYKGKKL